MRRLRPHAYRALGGVFVALAALAVSCGGSASQPSLLDATPSGGSGSGSAPSSGGAFGSGGAQGTGGAAQGGCADSDGDGLSDTVEGRYESYPLDADWDDVPDYLDTDSDDDGLADVVEAGAHDQCAGGRDTDLDSLPDWRDTDSDNDDVSDKDETARGLNPLLVKTYYGCGDYEQFWFNECDPQNVIVRDDCYSGVNYASTVLTAVYGISDLSDISIVVSAAVPEDANLLKVEALSVLPEGAGNIVDGVPNQLDGEAHITVSLTFEPTGEGVRQWTVTLESVSRGVVAQAQVLRDTEFCPILK